MKLESMDFLTQVSWLIAQAQAEGQTDPAAVGESTGAPTQSLIEQIFMNPLNLILISGFLFVLLVLRPQQKQMRELQQALAGLKKNDRVVTASGIHGTVVQANSEDTIVVLRIDDNSGARITINRDSIARIVNDETKDKSKDKDTKN